MGDVRPRGAAGVNMADEGMKKPISLRVNFTSQEPLQLNVKLTTPFHKVYKAVAQNQGVADDAFVLIWKGRRISKDETPKMLEMHEEELDDDDCIDIDYNIAQQGGSAPL